MADSIMVNDIDNLPKELKEGVFRYMETLRAPVVIVCDTVVISPVCRELDVVFLCCPDKHPDLFRKLFKQAEEFYKL